MINRIFFPKLSLWLFLLIPLLVIAFYPSYWSRLNQNIDTVTHVHAIFLTLWVLMSIVQPYLIMKKRTALHKLLWKFRAKPPSGNGLRS